MANSEKPGFLCICCDFKGGDFLRAIARLGYPTYLVTSEGRREDAWPYEVLTDTFFMPGSDGRKWNLDDLRDGTAHLMREKHIGRIIAMDDYDVRKATYLREEFRMPGMGQTTGRHFYDKLAMRIQARDAGIPVPGFSPLFNYEDINTFLRQSAGPWFVKPRSDAGSLGIRKVESADAFWQLADTLGDKLHTYLIEEYKPGDIFHVDSLSFDGEILFTRNSMYLQPPFDIAHGGGIFQSHTFDTDHADNASLTALNAQVLKAFGMRHGASHSEYIRHEGVFYFLETSARVGGAHLADMVEAASGINLWREWARIEDALMQKSPYVLPESTGHNAGIIASLSRYEHPDYSQFHDPEIWWTMPKKFHVGFIFQSDQHARIVELLGKYSEIIRDAYHAAVPLKE
jgi:biotin carboxylase